MPHKCLSFMSFTCLFTHRYKHCMPMLQLVIALITLDRQGVPRRLPQPRCAGLPKYDNNNSFWGGSYNMGTPQTFEQINPQSNNLDENLGYLIWLRTPPYVFCTSCQVNGSCTAPNYCHCHPIYGTLTVSNTSVQCSKPSVIPCCARSRGDTTLSSLHRIYLVHMDSHNGFW